MRGLRSVGFSVGFSVALGAALQAIGAAAECDLSGCTTPQISSAYVKKTESGTECGGDTTGAHTNTDTCKTAGCDASVLLDSFGTCESGAGSGAGASLTKCPMPASGYGEKCIGRKFDLNPDNEQVIDVKRLIWGGFPGDNYEGAGNGQGLFTPNDCEKACVYQADKKVWNSAVHGTYEGVSVDGELQDLGRTRSLKGFAVIMYSIYTPGGAHCECYYDMTECDELPVAHSDMPTDTEHILYMAMDSGLCPDHVL